MFIAELQRELTPQEWDIYRGHDESGNPVLTPAKCEAYRQLWRRQAKTKPPTQEGVRRKPCGCGAASTPTPPSAG